jgi:hypothetical protein
LEGDIYGNINQRIGQWKGGEGALPEEQRAIQRLHTGVKVWGIKQGRMPNAPKGQQNLAQGFNPGFAF